MKKVFNLSLLMAALVMIGLASCKPNEPTKVAVTGVTVSPKTLELEVNGTSKLIAKVAPDNATNKKVTWKSSDTSVATVNETGEVKAIKAGEATITVTTEDGGKTDGCKVTVKANSGGPLELMLLGFPAYIGDDEETAPGKHLYKIHMLPLGAIDNEGNVLKEGALYIFVVSGPAPSGSVYNPPLGKYTLAEDFGQMTLSKEKSTMRPFDAKGKWTSDPLTYTSGTFTIEAQKLSFKGTNSKNESVDCFYQGDYTFIFDVVNIWRHEPTVSKNITESFDTGSITNFKDFYQSGTRTLAVYSLIEGSRLLIADFFVPLSSTTLVPGTYNVSDTKAAQTLLKSRGFGYNAQPWQASSVLVYVDAQGKIKSMYFFASGTATVSANKVEFNVTSHFGSTLNLTYTGDMTPQEPPSDVSPKYLQATKGLHLNKMGDKNVDYIKLSKTRE